MSAYHGAGAATQAAPSNGQRPEPWEKTPWWHPYRWFGWDLQRSDGNGDDPEFEYGRSKKVAHEALRDLYAVDVPDPETPHRPPGGRPYHLGRKAKR